MANDYFSIEEACEKLSMTEEQIKGLVSDGSLREFRDAGKVLYSASEVDDVAAKNGSSVVDLEATDEAAPSDIDLDESESFASALSDLADSSASLGALDESPALDEPPAIEPAADGSGTDFTLSDGLDEAGPSPIDMSAIPEELPAAPKQSAAPEIADLSSEIDLLPTGTGDGTDAGLDAIPSMDEGLPAVPDLGLSGSSIISLEPTGDTGLMDSPIAKEGTKVSKVGISVFDDDELDVETDPMGETKISSGVDDFDAVGSGSGLLDLTQEPDDSSLGPELLDVISPSEAVDAEVQIEEVDQDTMDDGDSAMAVMAEEEVVPMSVSPVAAKSRTVSAEMAGSAPMNVCLLLGILGLITLGLATASVLQGVWPAMVMGPISSGVVHWSVFGGLALISIVTGVVAMLAGRK